MDNSGLRALRNCLADCSNVNSFCEFIVQLISAEISKMFNVLKWFLTLIKHLFEQKNELKMQYCEILFQYPVSHDPSEII